MDLHFHNDEYINPPGALVQYLPHPYLDSGNGIELSIFNEHRYAFFFWNKWSRKIFTQKNNFKPPCLVTIDWHQDLAWPTKSQKDWLNTLDTSSNKDTSLYAWGNLSHLNDEQIIAAAYLNIIGNVYVHCRQGSKERWSDQIYVDKYGNNHIVKRFKYYSQLEECLLQSGEQEVYFDIDLDYFTTTNPLNGIGKEYRYMSKSAIIDMLHIQRPAIAWILERMKGFTIAIEPEHTGGLIRANKILEIIDKLYFKPCLFSNYASQWYKHTNWKHLTESR